MIRDQRGVAMITVLLVGTALTVVSSTATFLTIQEFRASTSDRTSTQALGYAEAGLDRMIQVIKTTPWDNLMVSGCSEGNQLELEGELEAGSFMAEVTTQADCALPVPDPFEAQFVTVTAQGSTGEASRIVQQTLRVVSGGLPIGIYAYNFVSASGEGSSGNKFEGISLITQGNVSSRDKLSFSGFDPALSQFDVYGTGPDTHCRPSTGMVCTSSNSLPAAVHAGGLVTCDSANTCSSSGKTEHVGSPDTAAFDLACRANGSKGSVGQSAWDGTAKGGPTGTGTCPGSSVGKAPTSLFTKQQAIDLAPDPTPDKIDYDALKSAAQETGIYCSWNSSTKKPVCTKNGAAGNTSLTFQQSDLAGLPEDYIVYFDFPASDPQEVNWQAAAGNCTAGKSAVIVIRNGGIDVNGGSVAGGILAADGTVKIGGTSTVHGTIIAQTIDARGNSTFKLDECAVKALTAPFINVTPGQWSEVDRPA